MKKTIIFLSGFAVPISLAKTKFIWDDPFWKDYDRLYYTSKIPYSDKMVERELYNLSHLVSHFDNPIVAGQSLGAWWLANLACQDQCKINKAVLWTPLGDHRPFPIFNVSERFVPGNRPINPYNYGKDKVLLSYSVYDLIVPYKKHTPNLIKMFNPNIYKLYGGHALQINHKDGLSFMKEWVEPK